MSNANSRLLLDTQFHVGPIDRRIFGGFLEHLGRAVYEGVYDPGNQFADERGFRRDVLHALIALKMPVMRYPGGNYVSACDWKDGVGPKDKRPKRFDFAWNSIESNQFGTDEFMQWCKAAETAPMMAVNLGTAGGKEAAELVEYCNLPIGTAWADLRKTNGHAEPYGVKLWCLGNEMDGPWQAGHVGPEEYGRRARTAGAMMKGLDPTIETVCCGSSAIGMATYLEYDRAALEVCADQVDYISAHRYSANDRQDTPWFLAEGVEIQRVIDDYRGLLGFIRGRRKMTRSLHLSFDEWNVWYKERHGNGQKKAAPHLLEEVYNFEDALVCAQYLAAFVRNADVVKVACIAQVVNVIAPILTRAEGLLIQSIYHPFLMFSQHASGVSLRPIVSGATYQAGERGETPTLDTAVTFDASSGRANAFLINRDASQPLDVEIKFQDRTISKIASASALGGMDPKTANSWEAPHRVQPGKATASVFEGKAKVTVPAPGFVWVALETSAR